ncbi:hypothetical protein MTO96_014119 [Rhipicephalus appendiculatus]
MTDVLSEVLPSGDSISEPPDLVELAENPAPSPGSPDTAPAAPSRTRATKKRATMTRLRKISQPSTQALDLAHGPPAIAPHRERNTPQVARSASSKRKRQGPQP